MSLQYPGYIILALSVTGDTHLLLGRPGELGDDAMVKGIKVVTQPGRASRREGREPTGKAFDPSSLQHVEQ